MTATQTTTTGDLAIPAGTWHIDRAHSQVGFSVRHLGLSRVRGRFEDFTGSITVGTEPGDAEVEATIQAASVNTDEPNRDQHLRSADFLDVEHHPTVAFRSTAVREGGGHWLVDGELTLHGVARPVVLDAEIEGIGSDTAGNLRVAFTGRTQVDRGDFGLRWNQPLDGGGVLVGKRVTIELEVQAVLDGAEAA